MSVVCVQRWHPLPRMTNPFRARNECGHSLCASAYVLQHSPITEFFCKYNLCCNSLFRDAENMERVTSVCPSVSQDRLESQRERMWERESERGNREWSLSFVGGEKKARLDLIDDVYSWGGKDGGYGGVKGPAVWGKCVCTQCSDCVGTFWLFSKQNRKVARDTCRSTCTQQSSLFITSDTGG